MNNKRLDDAIKLERNAYMRGWRSRNKDKVAKANMEYWRKKALKRLESEQKDGE